MRQRRYSRLTNSTNVFQSRAPRISLMRNMFVSSTLHLANHSHASMPKRQERSSEDARRQTSDCLWWRSAHWWKSPNLEVVKLLGAQQSLMSTIYPSTRESLSASIELLRNKFERSSSVSSCKWTSEISLAYVDEGSGMV